MKILRPLSQDEFYELEKEIPSQCIYYIIKFIVYLPHHKDCGQEVQLQPFADDLWGMSPPSRELLVNLLKNETTQETYSVDLNFKRLAPSVYYYYCLFFCLSSSSSFISVIFLFNIIITIIIIFIECS